MRCAPMKRQLKGIRAEAKIICLSGLCVLKFSQALREFT